MSTEIVVALIAASGVIAAAVLSVVLKRRSRSNEGESRGSVSGVHIGHDGVVSGRDTVVIHQEFSEARFISRAGSRLLIEVSKRVIPDENTRMGWSSFDAKFLHHCVKDTVRGFAFDGEAFQAFKRPENDHMFGLGVEVYAAACQSIGDRQSNDYLAMNKIAQIYLSARLVVKGGSGVG